MRSAIRNLISKIRNQKEEHKNTRFVVSDVLDRLNDEKFGAEDTYSKGEINNLIAGAISGEYVSLNGTTTAKPMSGALYGQPKTFIPTKLRNFTLGRLEPTNENTYGLIINNDSLDGTNNGYKVKKEIKEGLESFETRLFTSNVNTGYATSKTAVSGVELQLWTQANGTNNIIIESSRIINSIYGGTSLALNHIFNETGIRLSKYISPTTNEHLVQKKYVDDAVAGISPSGFIPLTGTNQITGQLVATSYFIPTNNFAFVQKTYVDDRVANANYIPLVGATSITGQLGGTAFFPPSNLFSFVQKKYVDDSIAGIVIPTNYIPLNGSSSITGQLVATSYFTPSNANAFVQKKYVDDSIANIPAPTGFVPLTGTSSITGQLIATSYLTPTNNFALVQKKYVDDSIANIPAPTGFIRLTGSNQITGQLIATTTFTPTDENAFVQKKYVDYSNSVHVALVRTSANFNDGTLTGEIKRILIKLNFPQSGGTQQTFSLASYNMQTIIDVSGYLFTDNGLKQYAVNSGHNKSINTEVLYSSASNGVTDIVLSIRDDAFDAEVTLIIEYI